MLGMNLATLLFGLQRSLVGLLLVRCLGQSRCSNLDSYRLPTMLYLSRRFLLRQRGRYLLSPWRTHRFHEPSHRLSYLQSCLASWYYHRVSQQTRRLDSLNLTLLLDRPLIGGTFSNPASTFPNSTLFHHDLFRTYPYFLPGCIASAVSLIGVILGYFLLEEVCSFCCVLHMRPLTVVDSAQQVPWTAIQHVRPRTRPAAKISPIHSKEARFRSYHPRYQLVRRRP